MRFDTAVAIGEGAMGEVFRAYAPELGVDVAIKVLKRNDPEWVDRLRREAAAMQRIDHPNVCKIIEIGVDDGRHYVAMQFIDGQTLEAVSQSFSLDQRIRLLVEICSAVAAAHAEGLVHRDLKPANVLVEQGEDGIVKPWVMDFGLVKDSRASTLTVAGQILGTPNYMAPEQARGELTVDRRIDVYALGSILYFLLTDRHPFEAESTSEVIARLLSERIASPREVRPNLPAPLVAICLKAMERAASERYGSATELGEDLQAYLDGRAVKARSVNFWYHLRHRWQDHRVIIGTVGLLLFVALAATGTAIYNRLQLATTTVLAGQFGAVVERNAQMLRLAQMAPGTDLAAFRDRISSDYQQIEQRGKSLHGVAAATVSAALGRLRLQLGETAAAINLLQSAWDAGEHSPQTALALGLAHADQLRLAVAELALQRDPQLRVEMAALADQRWRQPALRYLAMADQGGIDNPDYGQALIAHLSADYELAKLHAMQALERSPWLFEAHLLIGRGWLDQARERELAGEVPAARELLVRASAALAQAQAIAPSASEVLSELCGTDVLELKFIAMVDYKDPTEAMSKAQERCALAALADSQSADALGSIGHAHALRARYLFLQGGGDPISDFEQAESKLARALELEPDSAVVLQQTVSMLRMRSFFESDRSVDPEPWVRPGLAHIERLLELSPTVYAHYNSWGNLLLDLVIFQRDYGKDTRPLIAESVQRFEQALELRADQPAVVMNLAVAYSLSAEEEMVFADRPGAAAQAFEDALATFDRAMALDPDDWDIPKNRAMLSSQYGRYLLQQGEDPRSMLSVSIAALESGLIDHPDDLTAMLGLAGSLKYVARAAFLRGENDQASIQRGLAVVAKGMALDGGRYVDLVQHGLALGRLQILLAANATAAQAIYQQMLVMSAAGFAKQDDPDPDLLMESAHLVLLAAELGLNTSDLDHLNLRKWLGLMEGLDPDDERYAALNAWVAAVAGKGGSSISTSGLSVPGQWRIALSGSQPVNQSTLREQLRTLPGSLWWSESLLVRLTQTGGAR